MAKRAIASYEEMERRKAYFKRREISTNAFSNAVKELEAEWYDVTGFLKMYPETYRDRMRDVFGPYLSDEISGQEFDRRQADLLREMVRKTMKPLPPEEWRRRYAEHDRQEKARIEREEARQKADDERARQRAAGGTNQSLPR